MEVVLIPRNVFAIWRSYFGFRLKHFSMVGDTAFYAFRERIQREIFRNVFCFLIVTGLWVKRFLIWAAFSKVLSIMHSMCPEEDLEVKLIFFQNNWATFSFGNWTKTLSFFYQFFPGSFVKNALFPSRLTLSRKWFSPKTFILVFCLDFERQTSGRLVKKWSTLPEEQLRKVVFTSSVLILDIVFSLWTNFLGFRPIIFNKDVNTATTASRWTTSGENFFRIN